MMKLYLHAMNMELLWYLPARDVLNINKLYYAYGHTLFLNLFYE